VPPLLRLLRPHQWTKNLLVWAAWVFTGSWGNSEGTARVAGAFVALCLISSLIYVVNDLMDVEADRQHPKKKNRPLASGAVSPGAALALAAVAGVGGFAAAMWAGVLLPMLGFLGVQAFYNLLGKQIGVVDVLTISAAFVVRAALGAFALSVKLSPWLLLCTGLLALFLAFSKRRQEFLQMQGSGFVTRASLRQYSEPVLTGFVWMSATLATMAYGLYVIESDTARAHPQLILTAPIVLFAVLRYLLLVLREDEGGEPELLLFRDRQMLGAIVLYLGVALWAMTS